MYTGGSRDEHASSRRDRCRRAQRKNGADRIRAARKRHCPDARRRAPWSARGRSVLRACRREALRRRRHRNAVRFLSGERFRRGIGRNAARSERRYIGTRHIAAAPAAPGAGRGAHTARHRAGKGRGRRNGGLSRRGVCRDGRGVPPLHGAGGDGAAGVLSNSRRGETRRRTRAQPRRRASGGDAFAAPRRDGDALPLKNRKCRADRARGGHPRRRGRTARERRRGVFPCRTDGHRCRHTL